MTHSQLVLSGNALEIYRFEKPVFYDFDALKPGSGGSGESSVEENRKRSMQRARREMIRSVQANYEQWKNPRGQKYLSKMWTLTFADNRGNPRETNPEFTLFIKRLNYALFNTKKARMKYKAVIEFQKRGAVHYHLVVFNLPFIDDLFTKLETAWGHGFIWTRKINSAVGAALYVAKYFTKTDDPRLRGIKSYFSSQGLFKPLKIRNNDNVRRILNEIPAQLMTNRNVYRSDHTGKTQVFYFDLTNRPDVLKYVLAQVEPPVVGSGT